MSKKLGNASATNADAKKARPTLTAPRRPAPNRSSRGDESGRVLTTSIAGAKCAGGRDT
jgi:hypothetical protein